MRPSELIGIVDPYIAYCLDEAIGIFGSWIIEELDKVKGKTAESRQRRRDAKLESLLTGKKEKMFSDPAAMFKRG